MKRYMIAVSAPDNTINAITRQIQVEAQAGNIAWGHHMPGVWMIVDHGNRSPADWWKLLRMVAPGAHFVLVDCDGGGASGWLLQEARDWISNQWNRNPLA